MLFFGGRQAGRRSRHLGVPLRRLLFREKTLRLSGIGETNSVGGGLMWQQMGSENLTRSDVTTYNGGFHNGQ